MSGNCTSHPNRYEGPCCHCGEIVAADADTFVSFDGKWKPIHLACRQEFHKSKKLSRLNHWANQTGKRAQRARKELRAKRGQLR